MAETRTHTHAHRHRHLGTLSKGRSHKGRPRSICPYWCPATLTLAGDGSYGPSPDSQAMQPIGSCSIVLGQLGPLGRVSCPEVSLRRLCCVFLSGSFGFGALRHLPVSCTQSQTPGISVGTNLALDLRNPWLLVVAGFAALASDGDGM